jgi:hypothetical protein
VKQKISGQLCGSLFHTYQGSQSSSRQHPSYFTGFPCSFVHKNYEFTDCIRQSIDLRDLKKRIPRSPSMLLTMSQILNRGSPSADWCADISRNVRPSTVRRKIPPHRIIPPRVIKAVTHFHLHEEPFCFSFRMWPTTKGTLRGS